MRYKNMKSLPSVFPAASTCALQCFSLRTKAPLPASHVALADRGGTFLEAWHAAAWSQCSSERISILKHSDEIVPTMIHSALWRGLSRNFRLWVAKQAQVILLRQQLTVASVAVSKGLSFYPRPCISPSAWKPSQLENWHPRFLQFSALPIVRK